MKKFRISIFAMVVAIITLVTLRLIIFHAYSSTITTVNRTNTPLTTERVFDNAGLLTNSEEDNLRKLIDKYQNKLGMDIVLVTTLEYMDGSDATAEQYAMDYYNRYNFGWDGTGDNGNGVIMVANFSTGVARLEGFGNRAGVNYTPAVRQHRIDSICKNLREKPYKASKDYIRGVSNDMTGFKKINGYWPWYINVIIGLIVGIVFLIINSNSKKSKVTVDRFTYSGGNIKVLDRQDNFVRKTVTSVVMQSSSSSGGGGSSSGGGGGGHGGSSGHF